MMQQILYQPPLQFDDDAAVALVIDPVTGYIYDECWTWEAGENYADQGWIVVAVKDDQHWPIEAAQQLYDYRRACFMDCFNRTTPF